MDGGSGDSYYNKLLTRFVLIGILLVTFTITRLVPGNPCYVMLGERATVESCNDFNHRYGLDKSIPEQFVRYMANLLQGDFGTSIKDRRPITTIIAERLPMTFELTILAMLFSVSIGIPLGVISALNRNSFVDSLTMVGANMGVSMPVFWLGLLLAYFFALVLKGTPFQLPPSSRLYSSPASAFRVESRNQGELREGRCYSQPYDAVCSTPPQRVRVNKRDTST